MIVLPDLSEQIDTLGFAAARRQRITAPNIDWRLAMRIGVMLLAAALFCAAAGMWAYPAGDYAVTVIKLGATVAMCAMGATLLSVLGIRSHPACIQIDTRKQEIRTYEQDAAGAVFLTGRYDLREMAEISLFNRTLFARDGSGRLVASVPVRSRRQERALRGILSLS